MQQFDERYMSELPRENTMYRMNSKCPIFVLLSLRLWEEQTKNM